MRRLLHICWLLWFVIVPLRGQTTLQPQLGEPLTGDSIIHNVVASADWYARIVGDYRADLYVKGHFKAYRRNILLRVVPSMFRFDKGVKDYIIESKNEVHYSAPISMMLKYRH